MTLLARHGDLTIRSISVSRMDNNVYLVTNVLTGAQVLIDAADDAPAILGLLAEGAAEVADGAGARLAVVLTTHSHHDHVRALAAVKEATGAPTGCGADDAAAIPVPMDVVLAHGDVVTVDGFVLEAIHLRGHTPGSICYVLRPEGAPVHLFTGDSLFPGGVGGTNGPEEFRSLFADVTERLFGQFDDDAVVWPGHGKPTTLGAERPSLPEWEARGW